MANLQKYRDKSYRTLPKFQIIILIFVNTPVHTEYIAEYMFWAGSNDDKLFRNNNLKNLTL